eukprot:scaffold50145_cov17-Prasinocladus_malaysianus.AAC.1
MIISFDDNSDAVYPLIAAMFGRRACLGSQSNAYTGVPALLHDAKCRGSDNKMAHQLRSRSRGKCIG